jgi:hypothetical protein
MQCLSRNVGEHSLYSCWVCGRALQTIEWNWLEGMAVWIALESVQKDRSSGAWRDECREH